MTAADRTLDLLVDTLAAARLTRLLTRDALTDGPRARLAHRHAQPPSDTARDRWGDTITDSGGPIPYLLHCPACSSVWVSAAVLLLRAAAPRSWRGVAAALACSEVSTQLLTR